MLSRCIVPTNNYNVVNKYKLVCFDPDLKLQIFIKNAVFHVRNEEA